MNIKAIDTQPFAPASASRRVTAAQAGGPLAQLFTAELTRQAEPAVARDEQERLPVGERDARDGQAGEQKERRQPGAEPVHTLEELAAMMRILPPSGRTVDLQA